MDEHKEFDHNEFDTETVKSAAEDGKIIAIVSYLTIIGLIIAFIMNSDKKNSFASYHIRQSLGLMISYLVLWVLIARIPYLGWILSTLGSIFLFVLWIVGLINAINTKKKPVPVLGIYFQDWFGNL
jgi:uncharacterized membrane protein